MTNPIKEPKEQLRECPFCGNEAHLILQNQSWIAECKMCFAKIMRGHEGNAIQDWNTRTIPKTELEPLDERNTYNLAEIIKHSPYFLKGNPWELAKDILSKSPRASEGKLEAIEPQEVWIEINKVFEFDNKQHRLDADLHEKLVRAICQRFGTSAVGTGKQGLDDQEEIKQAVKELYDIVNKHIRVWGLKNTITLPIMIGEIMDVKINLLSPARSEVDETKYPAQHETWCKSWIGEICNCRTQFKNSLGTKEEVCDCKEWKENISKIDAPIQLQAIRSGGKGYDGVVFKYCPWCGKLNPSRRS